MSKDSELRYRVYRELQAAGFTIENGLIKPPPSDSKEAIRAMHEAQRTAVLEKAAEFIDKWEETLLDYFADGHDIDPAAIEPDVRFVRTEEEAALFRFASLHWAVPVSQGYGRRNRFLVFDKSNGKLIAIFALGDPVFNLRARDNVIQWTQEDRQARLYNVFDAFVLGAVEPYRQLIAGKLVALCSVSNEVIATLVEKYEGQQTHIKKEVKIARPVLITTTSALGRSSIYNRITFESRKVFQSHGFTEGFGHFQFSEGLFNDLVQYLKEGESYRSNKYGLGPNWKLRTIRTALERIDIKGDLLKHGIQREVFLAPLATEWRAFLRGETTEIKPYDYPLERLAEHYRNRWAIPRAERKPEYREWHHDAMRLSPLLEPSQRPLVLFSAGGKAVAKPIPAPRQTQEAPVPAEPAGQEPLFSVLPDGPAAPDAT